MQRCGGLFSVLFLYLMSFSHSYSEECLCPDDYHLTCDVSVAMSLKQPCAKKCVQFLVPTPTGNDEKHLCSVREDILSRSRPAYLVDIIHHPCYCLPVKDYRPVCTSHFVTYLNECVMDCIRPGSLKASDGACVAHDRALSCTCFKNYSPVCATNGQTFSNACMFECFKNENKATDLKIAHSGACLPEDSPYRTTTLSKRSGPKHSEVSLENMLLALVDFDHNRRKPTRQGRKN